MEHGPYSQKSRDHRQKIEHPIRSGPVEIVKVGAEVATEDGAAALLQFAAVISVNLAVINSLPVPGLDGGQMVFVLAELARGKKLERYGTVYG